MEYRVQRSIESGIELWKYLNNFFRTYTEYTIVNIHNIEKYRNKNIEQSIYFELDKYS